MSTFLTKNTSLVQKIARGLSSAVRLSIVGTLVLYGVLPEAGAIAQTTEFTPWTAQEPEPDSNNNRALGLAGLEPTGLTVPSNSTVFQPSVAILGANSVALPALSLPERLSLAGQQLARDIASASVTLLQDRARLYLGLNTDDSTVEGSAKAIVANATAPWNGLGWRSPGFAHATSQLGSTVRTYSYPVSSGSRFVDLTNLIGSGNSLAQSQTTLVFDSNFYLEFYTFANSDPRYPTALSTMVTSTQPTQYTYIQFYVKPRYTSDNGKPVKVVFSGYANRSVYRQDNRTSAFLSAYANGQTLSVSTAYSSSSLSLPTYTVNTTFGSWVSVALCSQCYSTGSNSASQRIRLNIAVR